MQFQLKAKYQPSGDQPQAIDKLVRGVTNKQQDQVLIGVTGSGKTFTIANVIQKVQKPTLIISHNKTLAGQLYQEFRDFFPQNAVRYFVSYYDYYQPEAYIPQRDLYIEKDADINEEIDKLRLAATSAMMERKDVIIIASVSCIYNIGSPERYDNASCIFKTGSHITLQKIQEDLVSMLYERDEFDFRRGTFRVRDQNVDIYPAYEDLGIRITLTDEEISQIQRFDVVDGTVQKQAEVITAITVFPAKHYIFDYSKLAGPVKNIEDDLTERIEYFKQNGRDLEAHRIQQKVNYDLEMMHELGYCKGIENYSVYFDGRKPGEPPYTLMDYFPKDYLLIIDESHITVPQIRGMHLGDIARKQTLIDYGFRLPSAMDNRPLRFEEFDQRRGYTIYMSATPDDYEVDLAGQDNIAEQLIRPTGLVDPIVEVRPANGQVKDLIAEIHKVVAQKQRVLVTTLTKRMAEELSHYLDTGKSQEIETQDKAAPKLDPIKVTYLHSDIDTLERTDILNDLRKGEYDVLVGINLLREGLDLPEVSLVAILDADKEGFLRSRTSLIQTMGRAARHVEGRVILYADKITRSMKAAISEVERRRQVQLEYNSKHGITPQGIQKAIHANTLPHSSKRRNVDAGDSFGPNATHKTIDFTADIDIFVATYKVAGKREQSKILKQVRMEMKMSAEKLDFERAILLRDLVKKLKR